MNVRRWVVTLVLVAAAGLFVQAAVPASAQKGAGPTDGRIAKAGIQPQVVSGTVNVAIYNDDVNGPGSYFDGGDSNAWEILQTILDSDPQGRFTTTVVTDLGAATLSGFDVLVLPDNSVPDANVSDVITWFTSGKVIVCLDSAVSFAEYSGLFWPGYGGDTGDVGEYTLWDYDTCQYDGQIAAVNCMTSGYTLGQAVSTISGDAEYYPWMLPPDAVTFLVSAGCEYGGEFAVARATKGAANASSPRPKHSVVAENGVAEPMVYGVFRDIPGYGRMVLLGPYDTPDEYVADAWPMIRNACTVPKILSFWDDGGMSQVCIDTCGSFTWNVIDGYGAPASYSAGISVYNGGTMFWSLPGASQYVYVYYDPNNHMAWGYLYDYNSGVYSSLFDTNTLNDPEGCYAGQEEPPPPQIY